MQLENDLMRVEVNKTYLLSYSEKFIMLIGSLVSWQGSQLFGDVLFQQLVTTT